MHQAGDSGKSPPQRVCGFARVGDSAEAGALVCFALYLQACPCRNCFLCMLANPPLPRPTNSNQARLAIDTRHLDDDYAVLPDRPNRRASPPLSTTSSCVVQPVLLSLLAPSASIATPTTMSTVCAARAALSRLAIVHVRATARPCQQAIRRFSCVTTRLAAPEKVQTTSSFQSYPLPSKPPSQPRNEPMSETSIAGPKPSAPRAESESEANTSSTSPQSAPSATAQGPVAIPEREAQKTKPAPPKRKLKPRKAAIKLTPTAVEHLRALLDQPEPQLIKIGVRNRGCSGLAYNLEYVQKPGPFDEEVVQDGVKVLIDSKALFSIIGSEMDWVEDKLNQRFVFHNPNISKSQLPANCDEGS